MTPQLEAKVIADFERLPILASVGSYNIKDLSTLLSDALVSNFVLCQILLPLLVRVKELEDKTVPPRSLRDIAVPPGLTNDQATEAFRGSFEALFDELLRESTNPTLQTLPRSLIASVFARG